MSGHCLRVDRSLSLECCYRVSDELSCRLMAEGAVASLCKQHSQENAVCLCTHQGCIVTTYNMTNFGLTLTFNPLDIMV